VWGRVVLNLRTPPSEDCPRQTSAAVIDPKMGTRGMGLHVTTNDDDDAAANSANDNSPQPSTTSTATKPATKGGVKFTTKDLPFGTDFANGMRKWGQVVNQILEYAGTVKDVFAVNAQLPFGEVVDESWTSVFGPEHVKHPAILAVASAVVRTWRSAIGKRALKMVLQFLIDHQITTPASRAAAIAWLLADNVFLFRDTESLGRARTDRRLSFKSTSSTSAPSTSPKSRTARRRPPSPCAPPRSSAR